MRQRPQERPEPEKSGTDETRSPIYLWGPEGDNFHGGKHGTNHPTKDDTLTVDARESGQWTIDKETTQ